MKINLQYFGVIFFMLALTCITEGYAQEAGSPSFEAYDVEPIREREKVLSTPGESAEPIRPVTQPVTSEKDSLVVQMSLPPNLPKPASISPKSQPTPKEGDDSVLSFNFLYYLIQRYKMQDIVD